MDLASRSTFDKDQLLTFLLYHLTQETRQQLIQELPGAYQRVCGIDAFTVVRKRTRHAADANGSAAEEPGTEGQP